MPVLVFHSLSPRFTGAVTNYSPSRLAGLLRFLLSRGLRLKGDGGEAQDSSSLLELSFDDGYASLAEHLPRLMERFGFSPLVLVPTAWLGRWNRWDYTYHFRRQAHLVAAQVKRLADLGVRFGSHGHTHVPLTVLSARLLREELRLSKQRLEDLTGRPVTVISYPFGRCSPHIAEAAAEAGYTTGYTMRFPRPDDPPLRRGRIPVYSFDTPFSVACKLKDGPLYRLERLKSAVVTGLAAGTGLSQRIRGM